MKAIMYIRSQLHVLLRCQLSSCPARFPTETVYSLTKIETLLAISGLSNFISSFSCIFRGGWRWAVDKDIFDEPTTQPLSFIIVTFGFWNNRKLVSMRQESLFGVMQSNLFTLLRMTPSMSEKISANMCYIVIKKRKWSNLSRVCISRPVSGVVVAALTLWR